MKNKFALWGAGLFILSCFLRWYERIIFVNTFVPRHYLPAEYKKTSMIRAWLNYMFHPSWGSFMWLVWFATFAGGIYFIVRAVMLDQQDRAFNQDGPKRPTSKPKGEG